MNTGNQIPIEDIMKDYLKRVLEVNQYLNLTRVTDYDEAILLHLEDSLSVEKEISEAPQGLYGDLGSGGGFPGVPLAILSGRQTILIDSVKKKMKAVEDILDELDLSDQISTYDGRIEELAIDKPNQFSVLTARALTSLPSLLELASPLLKIGGELIAFKSKEESDFNNPQLLEKLGMKLKSIREYYLSDDKTYRVVYVFKKISDPTIKLPRRIGMAQKKPLI